MKKYIIIGLCWFSISCSSPLTTREKGTLLGVGVGGLAGGLISHSAGGALIGGALGGLSGAFVGDRLQSQEHRTSAQQRQINKQQQEINQLKRDREY